jgi:transcriptional regulator with XRE-family HTH domain
VPVPNRETLGARLERARELAGLNKNQLARAVGTSWQHLDHWERDRVAPSSSSLQRLAGVLAVSVAYLLGEETLAVPRSVTEALSVFLLRYAPPDLTEEETAWLRAAPVDPSAASPGLYLDLLHRLRTSVPVAPASAPPSTGRRAKVRLEDLPPEARAALGRRRGA